MTSPESPAPAVEEVLQERRCLGLTTKILYYLGIWPLENEPKSLVSYWRYYLPRVQLFRLLYSVLFNSISTGIVWGELHRMVEFSMVAILYVGVILRIGPLYVYRQTIARILLSLEKLCEVNMLNNEHLKKMAEQTERYSQKFTKFVLLLINGCGSFFQIGFIVLGLMKRKIPFRLWLPYDYKSTPIFEATLVSIYTLFALDALMLVFPILLFLCITIHLIGQYKLLRYNIENICKDIDKNISLSPENTSQVLAIEDDYNVGLSTDYEVTIDDDIKGGGKDEIEEFDDEIYSIELICDEQGGSISSPGCEISSIVLDEREEDIDEYSVPEGYSGRHLMNRSEICKVTGKPGINMDRRGDFNESELIVERRPLRRLPRQMWHQIRQKKKLCYNNQSKESYANLEMEKGLKQCLKHHQTILMLTKDMQQVFKVSLYFEIFAFTCLGVLALYITTLAPQLDMNVGGCLFILLGYSGEFFCLCWFGNKLTEESEKLREAVYGCEWYGASESFKRSVRIMISRTNRPEVLKAAGLPLSVKTFRFMCRTGYYLHNVMVKLIHGVKIND